jgi:hypothetical protein
MNNGIETIKVDIYELNKLSKSYDFKVRKTVAI